jgi:hypothetical protein
VSSDFLTKAGTMYLGERVWNRVRVRLFVCVPLLETAIRTKNLQNDASR